MAQCGGRLLPLPELQWSPCLGRGTRTPARQSRRYVVFALATELLSTVNSLYRGRCDVHSQLGQFSQDDLVAQAQRSSHLHLIYFAAEQIQARQEVTLTGAWSAAVLAKSLSTYGAKVSKEMNHRPPLAHLVDKPTTETRANMLAALPSSESAYYAAEGNVYDPAGRSHVIARELEQRFSFVGGTTVEYHRYFHRHLPRDLWLFRLTAHAVAGMSCVAKKSSTSLRQIITSVAMNYW